ncbi:hypothetical protein ABBQ38_012689 [Trebouxia sp. C0009 RCD-2024]
MHRSTQLFTACILVFVCHCAAQGGNGGKAKAVYAQPRSFSEWDHGLEKDPLVLVAFIAAIVSVPGFLLIMWQLVYDYIYAAAVSFKLCSKRALHGRPVQRRPSDFIVSSYKA